MATFDGGTVDLFLSGGKTLEVILWLEGNRAFAAGAGALLRDLGGALLVSADGLEAISA